MFKNLRIGTRLFSLVALFALLLLVVGMLGLRGMSSTLDSLGTVYNDRVVPLRDLKVVADMYAVNIVDATHKVRNGNISWAEARKSVEGARRVIANKWDAYRGTYLIPEELRLVIEIEALFHQIAPKLDKLEQILHRENQKAIEDFTINELYPLIDPISGKIAELIEIQLVVSKQEYDSGLAHYRLIWNLSVAAIVLGLLFGLAVAMIIIQSVTLPLNLLVGATKRIARGELDASVEIDSKDEIGKLALDFREMTASLRKAKGESEHQGWLKNKQIELDNLMRGKDDPKVLSQVILDFLALSIEAQVGTMYLPDEKESFLELVASHAMKRSKQLPERIRKGEGIAGQAVLEGKIMVVPNLPDDYFVVSTSLGEMLPRNLIVVPCIFNDELHAIIELGTLTEVSSLHRDFLEQVSLVIAIALHSSLDAMKVRRLLEEAKALAEELQVQQEELQTQNEELQAQSEELRASEEELRIQQEQLLLRNEEPEGKNHRELYT